MLFSELTWHPFIWDVLIIGQNNNIWSSMVHNTDFIQSPVNYTKYSTSLKTLTLFRWYILSSLVFVLDVVPGVGLANLDQGCPCTRITVSMHNKFVTESTVKPNS